MNLFKNLKTRRKLSLSFGLMILILISLSAFMIYVLDQIDGKTNDMNESLRLSDGINEAKYNLTWDKQLIMEVLASESKEEVAEQVQSFAKANKDFDEEIEIIEKVGSDQTWGATYTDLKAKIVNFASSIDGTHNAGILPMLEELRVKKNAQIDLVEAKNLSGNDAVKAAQLSRQIDSMSKVLTVIDKTLDGRIDSINTTLLHTEDDIALIVDGSSETTDNLVSFSTTALVTTSVIAVILALLISLAITNAIAKPLRTALHFAERIAGGDLTAKIELEQKDEIGDLANSLRKMIAKLQEVITSVISSTETISSASTEMSASAQRMSEGATEQASSVEEISSSMEEMAANIQQNTNNSRQTEQIAGSAAKDVIDSNVAVGNTVTSMKTIANKISIIGEISRQTNLLALNAAVEAARAGEHGRGFAVVAAEVRKLAERSQLAATEINDLSFASVDIAEKSGSLLKNVVPHIQKTSDLVQEIAASSIEQNAGADQINSAIQQLNQVVQSNAATAEEMAASSEELNAQAWHLKEIISFFKIEEEAAIRRQAPRSNGQAKAQPASKPQNGKPAFSNSNGKHSGNGATINLNGNHDDKDYISF